MRAAQTLVALRRETCQVIMTDLRNRATAHLVHLPIGHCLDQEVISKLDASVQWSSGAHTVRGARSNLLHSVLLRAVEGSSLSQLRSLQLNQLHVELLVAQPAPQKLLLTLGSR